MVCKLYLTPTGPCPQGCGLRVGGSTGLSTGWCDICHLTVPVHRLVHTVCICSGPISTIHRHLSTGTCVRGRSHVRQSAHCGQRCGQPLWICGQLPCDNCHLTRVIHKRALSSTCDNCHTTMTCDNCHLTLTIAQAPPCFDIPASNPISAPSTLLGAVSSILGATRAGNYPE
jgi:hypothetical protein